jgi:broad specificity phosphatase PhoE
MNRLYLVRHGENHANLTLEFSHRKVDYPLTAKGVLQAQQAAVYFAEKGIHAIYSSPLKRAQETAEIIGTTLHLPVVVMEECREVNVGDLEGQPPTKELWAFHNSIIKAWMEGEHTLRFPGGENYLELRQRFQQGLLQVTTDKEDHSLIIVAHGGIFSFTLRDFCPDFIMENLVSKGNPNSSISEVLVERREGAVHGQVVRWASVEHLSGEAANLVADFRQ